MRPATRSTSNQQIQSLCSWTSRMCHRCCSKSTRSTHAHTTPSTSPRCAGISLRTPARHAADIRSALGRLPDCSCHQVRLPSDSLAIPSSVVQLPIDIQLEGLGATSEQSVEFVHCPAMLRHRESIPLDCLQVCSYVFMISAAHGSSSAAPHPDNTARASVRPPALVRCRTSAAHLSSRW